jgi:hypothetical protein
MNKYHQAKRAAAIAHLGGKCLHCGFADLRAVQIDHVNGGGGKELRGPGGKYAMYLRVLAGDPGYQALCANCNWIKRAERNENPVGNR